MVSKWSKLGAMVDLGMQTHSGLYPPETLIRKVEIQLALGRTENAASNRSRRDHLMLMIHPRVGPVFPALLAEAKARQRESGKKLEHILTKLCRRQASTIC
jgi:hypothetical protein